MDNFDNLSQKEETNLFEERDEDKEEGCSSCLRFPKAIYFIIVTELFERFNYYGMRTILILYLTQHMLLNEENAISVYHTFVSLSYLTTIVGSFVADNYLGKYKTLIIIWVVYSCGSTLMSVTAIPAANLSGPFISLLLIAVGAGGVKACIAPFGGDQIPSGKKIVLDSFFSMFYFAINLGALMSKILTPMLRANVACFGSDDCYPLAFGVPAVIMIIALVILRIGKRYYVEIPIKNNIYIKAVRCIMVSIQSWFRERQTYPNRKLLDYASKEYDAVFIRDLRTLLQIYILYMPLPVYWALYQQMGSRWTLQAAQLDGEIWWNLILLPDQMSLLNVVMIMAFIPLFDSCIYPICYRIKPQWRPLRRMSLGIAITTLSFFVAFILQTQIERKQPSNINTFHSRLVLVNSYPCDVTLYVPDGRRLSIGSYQASGQFLDLVAGTYYVNLKFVKCSGISDPISISSNVTLHRGQINFVIADADIADNPSIQVLHDFHTPNFKNHPMIRLAANVDCFKGYQFRWKLSLIGRVSKDFLVVNNKSQYISDWQTLSHPGRYTWNVKAPPGVNINSTSKWLGVLLSKGDSLEEYSMKIFSSEVSILYMTFSHPEKAVILIPLHVNNGSQISILWQIPQYVLISIGEVLFSITGLSFSYYQAPDGMKSLVNAMWFLSNAIGNIIVIVVSKTQSMTHESLEYLLFGMLCIIFNIIFALLAYFYRSGGNDSMTEDKSLYFTE